MQPHRKRTLGAAIGGALTFGLVCTALASPPLAMADEQRPSLSAVEDYAPEDTVNLAGDARLSASSAYEAPQWGWSLALLVDGKVADAGWSTDPNDPIKDEDTPASVTMDFVCEADIERIVVFPTGSKGFPKDYYVETSVDGQSWTTVGTQQNNPDNLVEPQVFDSVGTNARFVRLAVEKRNGPYGNDGHLVQISEIAVFGSGQQCDGLSQFQPEGTTNIAPGAKLSLSSTYEVANWGWSKTFLTDGNVNDQRGWTTDPSEPDRTSSTPAWADLSFACETEVKRVVVFPREKNFPKDYRIEVSSDGETWTTVAESKDNDYSQSEPQVFDIANGSKITNVRLWVDQRSGPDPKDGYLVQISEIAVFGTTQACYEIVKDAIILKPGASESSWFKAWGGEPAPFSAYSSDPNIATVDSTTGVITAVSVGKTQVTFEVNGEERTVSVEVSNQIPEIGRDILVSAFWPPPKEFVTDDNYRNMAEAGIDLVQSTHTGDLIDRETNMEMARLAHKYGMTVSVADALSGAHLPYMSSEEVDAWLNQYTNVPGIASIYLVDEPADATQYADAFNQVRSTAPSLYPHINFFLYWWYGGVEPATNAMKAWLEASGGVREDIYAPDYLMYDLYPFVLNGATNYEHMLTNMEIVRKLGLEYNIKTGLYLQSIGSPGAYRRTNETEIKYEVNVALAYGYKQLSYFTWWTPTSRNEPFSDAIVKSNGEKTDLYEPVKQLNSEIHALGPTLMKLDAQNVVLNGETFGQSAVPEDFIASPQNDANLVLSHMKDRESGDDYVFVVNNSYENGQTADLKFADGIQLREVSRSDGSQGSPITLQEGVLQRDLEPGEGVLYLLEEAPEPVPAVDKFAFDPESVEVKAGEKATVELLIAPSLGSGSGQHFDWAVHSSSDPSFSTLTGNSGDEICTENTANEIRCELALPAGEYYAELFYGDHQYPQQAKLSVTNPGDQVPPDDKDPEEDTSVIPEDTVGKQTLPKTGISLFAPLATAILLGSVGFALVRRRIEQ